MVDWLHAGGCKEMSSIFADQLRLVIRVQMRGKGGVVGSPPMGTAVQCVHIT
jgi:hypothetical protein